METYNEEQFRPLCLDMRNTVLDPTQPPQYGSGPVCRRMTRYPFQPTSLSERSNFIFLWISGKSTRTIARETGVSPSTVCRWINRWKKEGNIYTRPRLHNAHFPPRAERKGLCHNNYDWTILYFSDTRPCFP